MICAWCGSEPEDTQTCAVCGRAPLLRERYRLDERLGKRGASATYRAYDATRQQDVVVKELLLRAVSDAKELQLFEREADLLERIDHDGVPKFLDHFEWSRGKQVGLYIVQEHLEGESLEHELEHHRPSGREVAAIMADVLDVLAALRELRVVHRDIKPANLVRTDAGIALVDFGAGRAVAESIYRAGSTVTGTFGYMAPEQMLAQAVPASDIYGLGATAVRLLTGRDPSELIAEHGTLQWRTAAPGIHAGLAGVVDAMLAAKAEDRPADLGELARALRTFAEGDDSALGAYRTVTALAPVASTELRRPTRREAAAGIVNFTGANVGAVVATGGLALLLLGPTLSGTLGFAPVFLLMVVTLGLAFVMGIRLRRAIRHFEIARNGTPVPAVVDRRFIDGKAFMVEVEHRLGEELHRSQHPVSEDRFIDLAEGDEVTVFCKLGEPQVVVLADAGVPAFLP